MITCSTISWGDQLGAQLNTLASLTFIARENNQKLVFWREIRFFRRGLQFYDVFDLKEIPFISHYSEGIIEMIDRICSNYQSIDSWKEKMNRIYRDKLSNIKDRILFKQIKKKYSEFISLKGNHNDIHVDEKLLSLDKNKSYDIGDGFGTYQDWKRYEDDIIKMLKFKKDIVEKGDSILEKIGQDKEKVAVHLRRADYLVMSSLNLGDEYYTKAMNMFAPDCLFVVFSDDIEECKKMDIFKGRNVYFMDCNSAGVDMYVMSKCDSNIIANSTFSFWGAFLNTNAKKVVCPHDFIGQSAQDYLYINGNYYPDNWIAI